MIFSPELIDKVLAGEKTVTRRRIRVWNSDCPYVAGRTYAVQPGRGRKSVARIRVKLAHSVVLDSINDADARREGFKNRKAFKSWWDAHYPNQWRGFVWRIEFEVVRPESPVSDGGAA